MSTIARDQEVRCWASPVRRSSTVVGGRRSRRGLWVKAIQTLRMKGVLFGARRTEY